MIDWVFVFVREWGARRLGIGNKRKWGKVKRDIERYFMCFTFPFMHCTLGWGFASFDGSESSSKK